MFYGDMRKLERRIERLERKTDIVEDNSISIYLDFNNAGEYDPSEIYLLAVVPPKSRWRGTR